MSEYRYVIQDDDDITHAANRLSIITTKAPVSAGEIVMWPDTFPVTGRTEHAVTMHAARVVTVCHVHGAYAAVLRVKVCPLPYNPAYTLSCAGLFVQPSAADIGQELRAASVPRRRLPDDT